MAGFAPYDLSDLILQIDLYSPAQELSDAPSQTCQIPIELMLKSEFKDLHASMIRSYHLSFQKFCDLVARTCGVTFNSKRDELGWTHSSPNATEPERFLSASSELTWQNALGVMQNTTSIGDRPSVLKIILFSPSRKEPVARPNSPLPTAGPIAIERPEATALVGKYTSLPA